ncbi:hypothetical protein A6M21_13525 [Desulfotomaculum copahuensis]|uniref:Spore protein YkvP/CgeB glycosyl transferase-like domain-containing protein n=2 Tax=Desulfotomaculum copahuensis TaxID=1838280 RepID=A0A1B7LCD4_9FIRM|nr:hypothetical protein A6M21_13525 [Desulfotomaculum copahuensis]
MAEALSDLGHEVHVIELTELFKLPANLIIERLHSINPDFALMYGVSGLIHISHNSREINLLNDLDIPFACLICDNPELIMKTLKWANCSLMHLFVWDEVYESELRKLGFNHTYPFALATNARRFAQIAANVNKEPEFRVPLAFIGSLPNSESIFRLQNEIGLPSLLLEALLRVRKHNPLWTWRHCIHSLCENLGEESAKELELLVNSPGFDKVNLFLDWHLTYVNRSGIVQFLESEGLNIWGGENWRSVLRDANAYRGRIDYETETPILYRSADIIIDVPSAQLLTSVNQRVFDVLAAGGFVVTHHQPDLDKFFKVGKEICSYRSKNELIKRIKHYLTCPDDRQEIIDAGRARVLKEHTYELRAKYLIDIMEKVIEKRRSVVPQLASTYFRHISCNICERGQSVDLFTIQYPYGGTELEFKMVLCQNCGLAYNNPQWNPELIADFYREKYHRTPNQHEQDVKVINIAVPCYEQELDFLEEYIGSPARILDVGSGTGSFTAVTAARGYEAWGVEPYRKAVETAIRLFSKCGGQYLEGYLEDLVLPKAYFNALVFNDVLEHLHKPKQILLLARDLLVSGGFLLVTVPDVESVIAKVQGYLGQLWGPPFHLYGFTRRTVKKLLESAGFEVLKCRTGLMYSGQIMVIGKKYFD